MMPEMEKHTRLFAIRLAAVLVLVTLLGTTLALLTRKEQSLQKLLGYHTKIKANLSLLRDDTRATKSTLTLLKRQIPTDYQQHSRELLIFSRLDQIKTSLKPLEMNLTALETKDGATSIGFTLKLPIAPYDASINAMGNLQTEIFPFIIFKGMTLSASPGTDFSVEGVVLMPELARVKP
jgi:hypothetical protein